MSKFLTKVSVAACAMSLGTSVLAAGFQLTEQSITGLGRSFAGAGIVGDDLSAISHNPAGLTLMNGTRVQQNFVVTSLDLQYKGVNGSTENGRDTPAVIPSGFVSHQVNENLWVGLGITVPYGLKVRYDSDWEGRERGVSGSILTVDFNPTIAWKVNDFISFGGGVSAMYTHSKIKAGLPLGGLASKLPPALQAQLAGLKGEFEYKGDDWMFTWDAGVMVSPTENLRFGLSYRSSAKVTAKGDYSIRTNMFGSGTVDGKGRLETPETVMFSGTWKAMDSLRFSGLIRWANWKNFDTMKFSADSQSELMANFPALGGLGLKPDLLGALGNTLSNVTIKNYWKATWLFTLGADWDINEKWTIRGGIGLETDPIKDQTYRTAVIPDSKRLWLSCGFSYKPTKNWQIDVAYAHLRGIGNDEIWDQPGPQATKVIGHMEKTNAYMVGAGIQYQF